MTLKTIRVVLDIPWESSDGPPPDKWDWDELIDNAYDPPVRVVSTTVVRNSPQSVYTLCQEALGVMPDGEGNPTDPALAAVATFILQQPQAPNATQDEALAWCHQLVEAAGVMKARLYAQLDAKNPIYFYMNEDQPDQTYDTYAEALADADEDVNKGGYRVVIRRGTSK